MKDKKITIIIAWLTIIIVLNSKVIHKLYISDSKRQAIEEGLTQNEVLSILGKPDFKTKSSWVYNPWLNFKNLSIEFSQNQTVRYKSELD